MVVLDLQEVLVEDSDVERFEDSKVRAGIFILRFKTVFINSELFILLRDDMEITIFTDANKFP